MREAELFHARFVRALESGNRNQVAGLFRYPMQVRVLGLDSRLVAVPELIVVGLSIERPQ